jgi:hypothetical protein
MLDLVGWTFVLALIPLALGLTWSLISGAVDLIRVRHARSVVEAKRSNALWSLDLDSLASSGSFGGAPFSSPKRFSASHRYGPH